LDQHLNAGLEVWLAFNAGVVLLLLLDLAVLQRGDKELSIRQAAAISAGWVAIALVFAAGLFLVSGSGAGTAFLTGYAIELSLSVDNIFVFVLIFAYFAVPELYQRRVLFWGILGVLALRGLFIGAGTVLFENVHWVIYPFGALLVISAVRMALQGEQEIVIERNFAVRTFRRLVPTTTGFEGSRFFVRRQGRILATPLFLILLVVDLTDVLFALDSVPAVFSVTHDPFIVYTSNIAATLGLRSIYFLLRGSVDRFRLMKPGLAAVLAFVGVKMLLSDVFEIPILVSLAVIGAIIGLAVALSLLLPAPAVRRAEHA
jgi:TerC family integral membrane protein